jgi:hypothetical protein
VSESQPSRRSRFPSGEPEGTVEVGLDTLLDRRAAPGWDVGGGPDEAGSGRERWAVLLVAGVGLLTFLATWGALVALPDVETGSGGGTQQAAGAGDGGSGGAGSDETGADGAAGQDRATASASATPSPSATPTAPAVTPAPGPLSGDPYEGRVRPVVATGVEASCEDGPSTDGAGATVTFEAAHATDGDPSTAWRCEGDGGGQRLTLDLAGEVPLSQVSIVPGWAQTDPTNGNDRYAQNRRVATARWTFDGGAYVEQELSTDPGTRAPQAMRIPPVLTSTVTVEVVDTTDAYERDATPVSEVSLGAARPSG